MSFRLAAFALTVMLALAGCPGEDPGPSAAVAPEAVAGAPGELVALTWQVRMADDAARAPFEAHAGWAKLFMRDYPGALSAFQAQPDDGRGLARMHMYLAGLHAQAALLAANAIRHTYGEDDRQPTDPVEVDYLLGAARGVLGDCEGAATAFNRLGDAGTITAPRAFWVERIANGTCAQALDPASVPPDTFPGQPGPVEAGGLPGGGDLPHYLLAEQSDEARKLSATDPTTLMLISRWHEAAAMATAPEADRPVLGQLLAQWRVGPSPEVSGEALAVHDAYLFAGFSTSAADAAFLVAARSKGAPAVDEWRDTSPLAAALVPAVADGKVDPEKVLERAAFFSKQVEAAMVTASGGEQGFHRGFADIAHVSVIRAGMFVADASDQYRDAGILRLNGRDRSAGPARDPVFFAAIAGWDTGNRNPLRAQELIHSLIMQYPAVEVARYPLDAMHVRLSRNAVSQGPVH